ncbi:MAG: hypothetical protein H7317_16525 [Pseudorhodobacter sp.]|nr:hypothetical protein [Pseudorhodobacter sp.]
MAYAHDLGRKAVVAVCPALKTVFVGNVPHSADPSRIYRQFVPDGAQMVFENSNDGDFIYDVAARAPEVAF